MALLDRITQNPFGQNTALSNGSQHSSGNQFRAQGAAYGRALRLLNRRARRGDVNASLKAIDVRDQANSDGYLPGGIGNTSERNADIAGRVNTMENGSQALEGAIDNNGNRAMGQPATPSFTFGGTTGPAISAGDQFNELTEATAPATDGSLTYQTELGQQGQAAQNRSASSGNGFSNLALRQGLDRAIGRSSKPAELNDLRQLSETMGVKPEAFQARAKWWERNRKL